MMDPQFDPEQFKIGRLVTEAGQQLLEQGDHTRLAACRLFTGDIPSLLASALHLLSGEPGEKLPNLENVTTLLDAAHALEVAGLSAQVREADSLEDAAMAIAANSSLVLAVNIGELLGTAAFFDSGGPNCLVMPVYAYRMCRSLGLAGFSLHCLASGGTPIFVTADVLDRAWLQAGGRMMIATNLFLENLS